MRYKLYTYDVWGNARDGFQVNDVYPQPTTIEVSEYTSDRAINRRLGFNGLEWDGEPGYVLYATIKRNGCPACELRAIEE